MQHIIKDELGNLPINVEKEKAVTAEPKPETVAETKPVVGTDENGVTLHSTLNWEADAVARMLRVPAGFMRDRTQGRVEESALTENASSITVELVERGLEMGRDMMEQLVSQAGGVEELMQNLGNVKDQVPDPKSASQGACPFHAAMKDEQQAEAKETEALNEVASVQLQPGRPR